MLPEQVPVYTEMTMKPRASDRGLERQLIVSYSAVDLYYGRVEIDRTAVQQRQ